MRVVRDGSTTAGAVAPGFGAWGPDDVTLRAMLGQLPVRSITRRPWAFQTSCPLDQVDVGLADGRALPLLLKDLSPADRLPGARRVRPAFLYDPCREILVYRQLLAEAGTSTPAYVGSEADPATGRYWLLLERVAGIELYQVGDLAVWLNVARWLAAFHARHLAAPLPDLARTAHLLVYNRAYYRSWSRRAVAFAPAANRACLARLAERYEPVVERLSAAPPTVLHGELYASNVLIQGQRVCPVDWETAAVGPGVLDLAALVAGGWRADERLALARAYHEALPVERREPIETLVEALEYARLHVAVQWLGWAADWTAPAEHAHDWLEEALRCAERLGL